MVNIPNLRLKLKNIQKLSNSIDHGKLLAITGYGNIIKIYKTKINLLVGYEDI